MRMRIAGRAGEYGAREAHPQRAREVGHHERDMPEKCGIEINQRLAMVGFLGRRDFLQHVRMAANRALPKNDHRTREYVRALDGDCNRHALVTAREIVARPHAYALAAM